MNSGDYITYADDANNAAQSGVFNFDAMMTILVVYCLVCGIATALIAKHNGRSTGLAFIAGFFLGQLGVVAHMIMGKSK